MERSDSGDDDDSDVHFIDEFEDVRAGYFSETEVEEELSSLSDGTLYYGPDGEHEPILDSEIQNSDDSSWHPSEDAEQQTVNEDNYSSTPLSSQHHTSSESPPVTPEEVSTASESSSSLETSAVSPSYNPWSPATSNNPATSTVQHASTSSEVSANLSLPVEGSHDREASSSEKTSQVHVSPRGKKRKKDSEKLEQEDSEEDASGQTCPICMDEWSNSGAHRLCCLKCGHIYGELCIRRWLTSAAASSGRCPQCNTKAKLRDIRPLFARSLRAIDTAERDRLAAQLEESKRERERLELEVTRFTMANQMQKSQMEKLQAELDLLRKGKTGAVVIPERGRTAGGNIISGGGCHVSTALEGIARDGNSCHFSLRSTVEIAREGGCRVAAHCETLNLVVVSQRSTNPLFPGFGVKKVDALEFRATQFVPAHPKPIRDLAFAPPTAIRSLLLSASFDCTARLLDVSGGANSVVATLSADAPLWSCCWDACDPNLLHVGTQGGMVLSFDVRRTSAPVSRISDPVDVTPVISLVPVQPSPGRSLPSGGLLSCHLSSCWAHDPSTIGSLRLPHEGPFTALRYESNTQHFLVSARPSARAPHARHSVCERALRPTGTNVAGATNVSVPFSVCNPPVHTFLGGTSQRVLSRPCLLPVGRDLVVAAHQESSSTVALWSVGTGCRVATIPASDPVIDVCPLNSNGDTHVALLTEKMLRLYRIH